MTGSVKSEFGLLFQEKNFSVVKKGGPKGERIEKHNHPLEDIILTVVKGHVEVLLNDNEIYNLKTGEVLHFCGSNTIQAELLEDSEFIVVLIKK